MIWGSSANRKWSTITASTFRLSSRPPGPPMPRRPDLLRLEPDDVTMRCGSRAELGTFGPAREAPGPGGQNGRPSPVGCQLTTAVSVANIALHAGRLPEGLVIFDHPDNPASPTTILGTINGGRANAAQASSVPGR